MTTGKYLNEREKKPSAPKSLVGRPYGYSFEASWLCKLKERTEKRSKKDAIY